MDLWFLCFQSRQLDCVITPIITPSNRPDPGISYGRAIIDVVGVHLVLMTSNKAWLHQTITRTIVGQVLIWHIDGLVQDCSISIANALELLQSCAKPSIWWHHRPLDLLQRMRGFWYGFVGVCSLTYCNGNFRFTRVSELLIVIL